MNIIRRRGFTLIELLTVIAVIAILASITFAAFSRIRGTAKTVRMDESMRQVALALTTYSTDHGTYPPGYGFVQSSHRDTPAGGAPDGEMYYLEPYLAALKSHGQDDFMDEFSDSYDTNGNGSIGLMEFSPIGDADIDIFTFPTTRYNGSNMGGEVGKQLDADLRPFVYAPINKKQFKWARRYWIKTGDFYAETWDPSSPHLRNVRFPPPSYDAFVLIGVGPSANTYGVLAEPIGSENPRNLYHLLALRTYFLATRDLNDNGKLDFHYEDRRQGEAKLEYAVDTDSGTEQTNNQLPPPPASMMNPWGRDGYGPYVYESPK